jgi:hypothetical protein
MSFKLDMSIDKRYKDGKIYKIVSDKTDMVYIGSTIQTLIKRLCRHKTHILGQSHSEIQDKLRLKDGQNMP